MQKHVEAVNAVLRKNEVGESDESELDGEEGWRGSQEEPRPIDLEEEFIDDDKFTKVTVEAVDVSRDGLKRVADDIEEPAEEQGEDASARDASRTNANGKRMLAKERPKHSKNKLKKKTFKYESKTDRKLTRFKERGKGKRQAKERKGK